MTEETSANKPRREHSGRQIVRPNLERVEENVVYSVEDCRCGRCGQRQRSLAMWRRKCLTEYFVRVIKREKREARLPTGEEQGVRTAKAIERIAP